LAPLSFGCDGLLQQYRREHDLVEREGPDPSQTFLEGSPGTTGAVHEWGDVQMGALRA
jgi:hypothetical protein